MKSYCRVKNQYILIGRLLDKNTLQVIQDTKIIYFEVPTTDLIGDVVCTYKKEGNQIIDICLYPIQDTSQFVNLEDGIILITNKKCLQDVKTDRSGIITLNFKDYKLEVPKYINDFYHVFLITDTKLLINSNMNLYTGSQIV